MQSPTSKKIGALFSKKSEPEIEGDLPPEVQKLKEQGEDRQIAAWVKKKYDQCKLDNSGIRNQWYINLAFYKGDQYVNLVNGKLFNAPPMPNRVRMVVNRIRPAMRTQVSRMVSQRPTCTVIPASSEDEDILSAEAGESVWEHVSNTEEFQKRLIDAAWWASNTGVGYLKQEWDKSEFDKQANNGLGAYGNHRITAPTPFHIHVPNLLERDIEDQPFVIHSFTKTLEEAKICWPEHINEEHEPTVVGSNEIMETQYLNLKGAQANAMPDSCLVLEAWVKPGATPLFPKGGMAIVVDDKVVYKTTDGIPYNHGEFPFAKIDDVLSGGYYSTSTIEDLIPLQKEINRNRSQGIEFRNLAVKPGYFVQEGSVDLSKWKSRAGQLVPVKVGFTPPVAITPPTLPSSHSQDLEISKMDFEDISGQHQVSKGNVPSGVTAATAISFLQEQDQSFMAPTYTSIELAIQKVGRQVLQNSVQFWDESRLIKAAGNDQAVSVRYLTRSDIKNGTDLRVEGGSSMPESKAARLAFITGLMDKGQIPADKGLEMLNLPNMRSYYALIKIDENQARRENIKLRGLDPREIQAMRQEVEDQKQAYLMQMGIPDEQTAREDPVIAQLFDQLDRPMLPVNDWDNDEIHIFEHHKFMKSQAFEMLEPEHQEEFIRHVEAHKAKQQSTQLNQLMMGGTSNVLEDLGEKQPANGGGAGNNESGENQFSGIEQPVDSPVGQ